MVNHEGRTAVVTAAAGGVGRAIAIRLANAGADLAICDIDEASLDEVAQVIREAGRRALAVPCDVSVPTAVEDFIAKTLEEYGHVDIVVNNAGRGGPGAVADTTYEEWRSVLSLNLDAAFLTARAFIPGMRERGWGRLVQIASLGGKRPFPHAAAYSTSKTAMIGLTRSIALDYAADGITSNAICPSWVMTNMAERFASHLVETDGVTEADAFATMAATLPQGRLLDPDEVANLVVMLTSDEARGVNGDAISIDQGAALC